MQQHLTDITEIVEQSSSVARLKEIECYQLSKIAFLRFVFTTGDAAGEISLAVAIASLDWVAGHEKYGRNKNDEHYPTPEG